VGDVSKLAYWIVKERTSSDSVSEYQCDGIAVSIVRGTYGPVSLETAIHAISDPPRKCEFFHGEARLMIVHAAMKNITLRITRKD
jgi:hypothetical protein